VPENPQVAAAGPGSLVSAAGESQPGAPPAVDVQQLADKVYALLLADVRLGRARGDVFNAPRRNGRGD
jgi:hypothetical protein